MRRGSPFDWIAFDPESKNGMTEHISNGNDNVLQALYETIASRKTASPDSSYTAKLFNDGRAKIACKINEEAVEVLVAALHETPERVVSESADVLYHLMVLWADTGVTPDQVMAELARRTGQSGIDEKRSRAME